MKADEQGGITLHEISVQHERSHALRSVSLQIPRCTLTAMTGPNGAGKSTLLNVIAGILKPSGGTLQLNGAPLPANQKHVAQTVAILTQQAAHLAGLTAHETVLLGRSPWAGAFGLPSHKDHQTAEAALDELGIAHLGSSPIERLSTGERQRVHFARVLCQNTPFLLFDEPFSAQDVDGVGTMLRALKKRTTLGHTVVVVLHDLNLALGAFESLIVMQNGQILGHGTPDDAISALTTVYGQTLQFDRGDSVRVALPVWR